MSKHDACWRYLVIAFMVACQLTFFIDFAIEQQKDAQNQLNRKTIIVAYIGVGVVFVFFSLRLLKEAQFLRGELASKNARRVSKLVNLSI